MKAKEFINKRFNDSENIKFTKQELKNILDEYYIEQLQAAKLYYRILQFAAKILAFPFFIILFIIGLLIKFCQLVGLYFWFGGEVIAYHTLMKKKTITYIYFKVYDLYKSYEK